MFIRVDFLCYFLKIVIHLNSVHFIRVILYLN